MYTQNPLILKLKEYGMLSHEVEKEIEFRTKKILKKKNDYFLKEGQILTSYFILYKGVFRAYIYRKDKEINVWFGQKNQFFGAAFANRPSPENIQFLEDSEVYAISTDDLHNLYKLYPELNLIGIKIAEELCVILEDRITSLHTENAHGGYQPFIKEHPNLINRINLDHIESYIGVTEKNFEQY